MPLSTDEIRREARTWGFGRGEVKPTPGMKLRARALRSEHLPMEERAEMLMDATRMQQEEVPDLLRREALRGKAYGVGAATTGIATAFAVPRMIDNFIMPSVREARARYLRTFLEQSAQYFPSGAPLPDIDVDYLAARGPGVRTSMNELPSTERVVRAATNSPILGQNRPAVAALRDILGPYQLRPFDETSLRYVVDVPTQELTEVQVRDGGAWRSLPAEQASEALTHARARPGSALNQGEFVLRNADGSLTLPTLPRTPPGIDPELNAVHARMQLLESLTPERRAALLMDVGETADSLNLAHRAQTSDMVSHLTGSRGFVERGLLGTRNAFRSVDRFLDGSIKPAQWLTRAQANVARSGTRPLLSGALRAAAEAGSILGSRRIAYPLFAGVGAAAYARTRKKAELSDQRDMPLTSEDAMQILRTVDERRDASLAESQQGPAEDVRTLHGKIKPFTKSQLGAEVPPEFLLGVQTAALLSAL